MLIPCKKSVLRSWTMEDLNSLVLHANNPKIAENLRDVFPNPYTMENARFFIENVASDKLNLILAIEVDNMAIGAIGIHPQADVYRKNAELGYWIGESYWGRGIMTDAVTAIVDYTFQHFDIHRIYAGVFEYNKASMRILEKCGFELEAILRKVIVKNNKIFDEYLCSKLKHKA